MTNDRWRVGIVAESKCYPWSHMSPRRVNSPCLSHSMARMLPWLFWLGPLARSVWEAHGRAPPPHQLAGAHSGPEGAAPLFLIVEWEAPYGEVEQHVASLMAWFRGVSVRTSVWPPSGLALRPLCRRVSGTWLGGPRLGQTVVLSDNVQLLLAFAV